MEERIIKPSQLHCLIEVKDEALQNSLMPKLNKTFQMNNNLHNMKSFNNTGEDLKVHCKIYLFLLQLISNIFVT